MTMYEYEKENGSSDFATIEDALRKSMDEERLAARVYRERATAAFEDGDVITGNLWLHIAEEEEGHYHEFSDRLAIAKRAHQQGMHGMSSTRGIKGIPHHKPIEYTTPADISHFQEIMPFPKTYGDWVDLAEKIKVATGNEPSYNATINFQLQTISGEGSTETPQAVAHAKRWLVDQAGVLGIS